ncbi:unnamed protein product [Chilo suppressalis]|uniref:Uncharacterized protein n=1 Tax=Chilo suppressalis TaxID=168631 RepID=A0ABN8B919_CHISP|nr:unnamed protein product [Chilo suppressalis]
MALTTILFVCILAGVNAGYVWVNDGGAAAFSGAGFPGFSMPPISPPRPMFGPGFPFDFVFSHVPFPRIPTVDEMKNTKPGPNQIYNGVAVRSSSSLVRDKDGKLVPAGGTSILVNENGQVHEQQIGKNPPKIDDPIM